MTSKSIHLICNEFSRGIGHDLEWWKYRLALYENYTLKSIVNQTNQNFHLFMIVDNRIPLLEELERILKNSGLKYLLVKQNVKNDFENKISTLPDFDYIYTTRIDTDDLFRDDVVEEIQKHEYIERRALVFQKGYCYDVMNKKLQHYYANSPPFSTILYPREIFIDEDKRRKYMNIQGHDQIFTVMNSLVLSENKFVVLIHEHNQSSVYLENETRLQRYEIDKKEHLDILNKFGLKTI